MFIKFLSKINPLNWFSASVIKSSNTEASASSVAKISERGWQAFISTQLPGWGYSQVEKILFDNTRCDLYYTKTPAYPKGLSVEIDWLYKMYEGVGQAKHYSGIMDSEAGLILLVENKDEDSHLIRRSKVLCKRNKIFLFLFDVKTMSFFDSDPEPQWKGN
jgi:hypothetical protein